MTAEKYLSTYLAAKYWRMVLLSEGIQVTELAFQAEATSQGPIPIISESEFKGFTDQTTGIFYLYWGVNEHEVGLIGNLVIDWGYNRAIAMLKLQ